MPINPRAIGIVFVLARKVHRKIRVRRAIKSLRNFSIGCDARNWVGRSGIPYNGINPNGIFIGMFRCGTLCVAPDQLMFIVSRNRMDYVRPGGYTRQFYHSIAIHHKTERRTIGAGSSYPERYRTHTIDHSLDVARLACLNLTGLHGERAVMRMPRIDSPGGIATA